MKGYYDNTIFGVAYVAHVRQSCGMKDFSDDEIKNKQNKSYFDFLSPQSSMNFNHLSKAYTARRRCVTITATASIWSPVCSSQDFYYRILIVTFVLMMTNIATWMIFTD